MSLKFRVGLAFSFLFICTWGYTQSSGNSPYSQLGIGDINNTAFVPNIGMGGAGLSHANGIYINHLNPALLARNRVTIFDVGVSGQLQNISTRTASQRDFGGNLSYLAYAFPVTKRWTLGAVLRPYSNVDYEINATSAVVGSPAQASYTYSGQGGLTSVEFTNAVNIIDGLSLGVKAAYIFGNITNESVSGVSDGTEPVYRRIAYVRRTNYSDFVFNTGLAYRKKLRNNLFVNGGLVYDLSSRINGNRFTGFQQRDSQGNAQQLGYDTLAKDLKGSVSLPAKYKVGFSLDNPFHWAVVADFTYQDWSGYKDFNVRETLGSSYTLAVGGEWTPDINSVSNAFKRITYRTGFHYGQTPILLNGEQISDLGINFGISVPIGRGFSTLNLAFTGGQRGTLNNNLIKEQYLRVAVGFTLNGLYDRWFQKNKID